jgi:glycine cleavage system H protein
MIVPDDLRYAESHEWVRTEGDIGTVGITDHAQAELTDIVYVELPQVGASLATRQTAAVVESVKAASDIYAPMSGEVVETNAELESNPALVNTDPYNAGWLFKLKLANPQEISSLKTAAEYSTLIGG